MVSILIWLVVLALVWYLGKFILCQVGGPPWIMTVFNVLLALVVLVWLLGVLGVVGPVRLGVP